MPKPPPVKEDIAICQICKKPFEQEYFRLVKHTLVNSVEWVENTFSIRYHSKCIPITVNMDMKQLINDLSPKERLELYKYLYNTWGCRI